MLALVIADNDSAIGTVTDHSAEILISLGDLWEGSLEKARTVHRCSQLFGVRGNHDTDVPFPDGFIDLHCRVARYGNVVFGGFSGSWKYKPFGYHLYEQKEVSRLIRAVPAVDVFVAHNSPRGYHERDEEVHQGFDAFVDYIDRHQPRYFLHGHQHLSRRSQRGRTTIIGTFGEELIELDFDS